MISTRLKSLLEKNGIPFEVVPHDPAFTAQHLAARMHVPGREFVKAVVVRLDGRYALAAVPAHRLVDEKALARVARAGRCALASEAEFRELFPECELGAMPPVGILYGLETYVDAEVTRDETVVANAGTHAEAIRLRYADLARVARPTVGRFAVPSPAEAVSRRQTGRPRVSRPAAKSGPPKAAAGARETTGEKPAPGKRPAAGKKKTAGRRGARARPQVTGSRKAPRSRAAAGPRASRGKTARRRKTAPRKRAAKKGARGKTVRGKVTRGKTARKKSRHS